LVDVSLEKLFGDVSWQLTGLLEVLGPPAVASAYASANWTAERLRQYLVEVLGGVWRDWWIKSRRASRPRRGRWRT
jgi:hypothetical protein